MATIKNLTPHTVNIIGEECFKGIIPFRGYRESNTGG